ncbi:MAG: ATP-dependent sacrificial sulfur transferase LarE [Bacteroidales bacterium]
MLLPGEETYRRLYDNLKSCGALAVAFSGGTDSGFLLAAASDALGDNLIAYTIQTSYISSREIGEALEFTGQRGIRHRIIRVDFPEIIRQNPPDRCYLCKKNIFSTLLTEAAADGFGILADGTNADDTSLHRPGLQALKELKIRSPLMESGLSKAEIRRLSSLLHLPGSDKPALACLLTRIPYNTEIQEKDLVMIEKAETFLHELGFPDVRVRTHGTIARIETDPSNLAAFLDKAVSGKITIYFKEIGYTFITLDLEGYRMGGMDQKNNKM